MNAATTHSNPVGPDKVMDVRSLPCSIKHGLIVRTFRELSVGDYFILRNGHDPVRLRDQFAAAWPDTFAWEYLAQGPDDVQVRITKLKSVVGDGPDVSVRHECG